MDSVLIATPMDLRKLLDIKHPSAIASYGLVDMEGLQLRTVIDEFVKEKVCCVQ